VIIHRLAFILVAAFLVAGLAAPARGQDAPEPEPHAAGVRRSIDDRLADLRPEEPRAYFLLAEEAADVGRDDLARRLFAIAAHLDPEGFGRSAALALADLARRVGDADEARRLRALSEIYPLPPSLAAAAPPLALEDRGDDRQARVALSAAFGYYRQGDGIRALRVLEREDAETWVEQRREEIPLVDDMLEFAVRHPKCPECNNRRLVKCPACQGGTTPGTCDVCLGDHAIRCRTCDGHPGPDLEDEQLDRMLQFEIALLAGRGATWSAQFALDGQQSRPVLAPSRLDESLGLDATRCVYRDGSWVRPEDASPASRPDERAGGDAPDPTSSG